MRGETAMRLQRCAMAVTAVLGLAASAPDAAAREGYGDGEIVSVAGQLAEKLGMPADKRATAQNRLAALLKDARFHAKYGGLPVRGVFAYQMGEGGLIVKVKKGRGLVRWSGEAGNATLALKSVTVGARSAARRNGASAWCSGCRTPSSSAATTAAAPLARPWRSRAPT